MNSPRLRAGTEEFEKNMIGISASFAIGVNAESGSNDIFVRNWLMTKLLAAPRRIVYPSASARAISSIPILPAAPGFDSMTSF